MHPKQFTDRQYTKIRFFCKVTHNHKIPSVWTEMIEVTDDDQRREILTSAIKIAPQQHTVELGTFYLSNEFMKALMKLEFVPMGETRVNYGLMESGLSILVLGMETLEERMNRKLKDHQIQESALQTIEEQQTQKKSDLRQPP